jgi:hypothetical protein
MRYFLNKKWVCFVLACTAFASCIKKDAFDFSNASVKIDGTWGVNLVNNEVFFTDFTLDSAISIVSDNDIVKLVYSAQLVSSGKVKDLFDMVDYHWGFSLTNIDEPNSTPYRDTVIFSGEQDILFYGDTDKVLMDTAVFNEGVFELKMNNTFDHEVRFRIKSAYFHYPDGKTLDKTVTIPYNAKNFSIKIDLTGCRVKLKRNSLPCEIEIIAFNDGHPFSGAKKSVDVDVYGQLYVLKFLEGQVTSLTERTRDTLDFSIISDKNMSFLIKDIRGGKIRVNTVNSFGVGVSFTVDTCMLIADGGMAVNLLSAANSTFTFEPAISYFTPKKQSFTIDINDFSLANRNVFRFAGSVLVNEAGMTCPSIWARDTSSFSIEPSLEIPLDINLNHFIYRDTIAQDMSGIALPDSYKDLVFRIEITNDFPIELNAQLYFLDGNHRVVDSLFPQSALVAAASTNYADGGKTIAAGKMTPSPLFIEVSDVRLTNIHKAKYLYIQAKATSNNQRAIVRSDQKLKIRVGVKTTLKSGK